MRERLTKSEMAIMEILWEEGKGLTATEIVNIAGEKKTWKDSSIHLLINHKVIFDYLFKSSYMPV